MHCMPIHRMTLMLRAWSVFSELRNYVSSCQQQSEISIGVLNTEGNSC